MLRVNLFISRLLKNGHLRRFPHPSPCQARGRLIAAYCQVHLIPQDFGRLASDHFWATWKRWLFQQPVRVLKQKMRTDDL